MPQPIFVPAGSWSAKTTLQLPLASSPASSIPLDSTPQNLAGFRFTITIMLRPTRSSGSYQGWMEETI